MTRKSGAVPEETKMRLLESAALEFASYGFAKASLRRICANAEVTTGALYFFFQDKEDLFRQTLSPATGRILALLVSHYEAELASSAETLAKNEEEDFRAAEEFLEFYFSNQTVCQLILNNREHPAVEEFFNQITSLMDRQTYRLIEKTMPKIHPFNDCTIHWFSHLQLGAVMHILSHDFDEKSAKEQLKLMVRFLRGGFLSFLPENGQNI